MRCSAKTEDIYVSTAGWTIAILFKQVQPTFTLNVSCQSRMLPLDWSRVRRHDHIIPVLTELHWLPVCKRVMFKFLLLYGDQR